MLQGNSLSFLLKKLLLAGGLFLFCCAAQASDQETATFDPPKLSRYQEAREKISDVLVTALSAVGIRYRYGGNDPTQGLDCSGLVRYVFQRALGKSLPRTSEEISRVGE